MLNLYELMSVVLTLAIGLTYVNHRYIKLPLTIAMMAAALGISLIIQLLSILGLDHHLQHLVATLLARLDFRSLLLDGMLSFLLFAGALTVDLNVLLRQKWEVGILAIMGTIFSTLLIGFFTYYGLQLIGLKLDLIYCMLFGALISPTDPIAVLAMCKELNAPKPLSVSIAGESLFNDGVGIVIFLTLFQLAFITGPSEITVANVCWLFLREALGGLAYGAILGYSAYKLLKPIQDHKIEILITVAVATGGYVLAQRLGISGPLAMVVAGLFIGNTGKHFKVSRSMSDNLFQFWEIVDEILNVVLFLLIGFELILIKFTFKEMLAGLLGIGIVLGVRFIVVSLPFSFLKIWRKYSPHVIKILTWGGLRGGLAVALALSLPTGDYRELILTMTYFIVVFSILIQGLTMKKLVKLTIK